MIAFSIGPINIYRYWIFYLVWFLFWYWFLWIIWKSLLYKSYQNLQKLLQKNTDDILMAIILWVLLGWRLWEVFIYQRDYYSTHLMQIFAVWKWWMSFIWWIIWVAIALFILKKIKKLSSNEFWLLVDTIVAIVPLAILLWRFWNYLNQELYWLAVPDNFWWLSSGFVELFKNINIFHVYSSVDSSLRINTNFLSMIFEWFVLFLITSGSMLYRIKLSFKKNIKNNYKYILKPWFIIWLFLIFYSLFRFFLEYLRVDSQSQYILAFTRSQWIFLIFIIVWLIFVFRRHDKHIL